MAVVQLSNSVSSRLNIMLTISRRPSSTADSETDIYSITVVECT